MDNENDNSHNHYNPMPTVKADIKGIGSLLIFIVIMFIGYYIVLAYNWITSILF